MDDFEYDQLVLQINELVDQLENLPDSQVKQNVFELLKKLDALHREALVRILNIVETKTPRLLTDFQRDFVIQTLLILYEFAQVEQNPQPVKNNGSFIPIDQLGKSRRTKKAEMPVWIPVANLSEIDKDTIVPKRTEDVNVLLCKVQGELYAIKNECIGSILPLDRGKLEDGTLVCPWHGCKYDVRTGEIQNGSGLKQEVYPTEVSEDGKVRVGLNM